MSGEWKRRVFLLSVLAAGMVGMITSFKTPAKPGNVGQKPRGAISARETDGNARPEKDFDLSTREGVISGLVSVYESMNGEIKDIDKLRPEVPAKNDNIIKAVKIGIIDKNDSVIHAPRDGTGLEAFSSLCYKMLTAADSSLAITEEEAAHILNYEYNNAVFDDSAKIPYAFMIKHGLLSPDTERNPVIFMKEECIRSAVESINGRFNNRVCFEIDKKAVKIGESAERLTEKFGMPNRIDKTEYGFEWYVYNEKYDNFMMVGIENGVVTAFCSNSEKLVCGDIKHGMKMKDIKDPDDSAYIFLEDETTATLDAIVYMPYTEVKEYSEEIFEGKSRELFDLINAERVKKKLAQFIAGDEISQLAFETVKQLETAGIDWGDLGFKAERVSAADMFRGYEDIVSLRHESVWKHSPKTVSYCGTGVYGGSGGIKINILLGDSEKLSALGVEHTEPPKKEYPPIKRGIPEVYSPLSGDVIEAGSDVIIKLSGEGLTNYHVDILNCESRDYIVNADVTGDVADYRVPAQLFEKGVDYAVAVSGEYGGETVLSYTAEFSYGGAGEVTVLSPGEEHELSEELPGINIIWKSDVYTDFLVELFDKNNNSVASSRVIDTYSTEITGLAPGRYTVRVTALRRDTNTVKAAAESAFEIMAKPTPAPVKVKGKTVKAPAQTGNTGSAAFKSNRYAAVFGNGVSVYSSKAEADRNMVTIQVPVWHVSESGEKVPATEKLTVNAAIAGEVEEIFMRIYNSPERFPIKSVGGYNWRDTATGGRSQHSYGTCIDINPAENYCIYRTGRRIGSFWKPGENIYSMPADGSVVSIFKAYGWTWGGDWNSLQDYMHFSYLGG